VESKIIAAPVCADMASNIAPVGTRQSGRGNRTCPGGARLETYRPRRAGETRQVVFIPSRDEEYCPDLRQKSS
jgi:hypothetical protein